MDLRKTCSLHAAHEEGKQPHSVRLAESWTPAVDGRPELSGTPRWCSQSTNIKSRTETKTQPRQHFDYLRYLTDRQICRSTDLRLRLHHQLEYLTYPATMVSHHLRISPQIFNQSLMHKPANGPILAIRLRRRHDLDRSRLGISVWMDVFDDVVHIVSRISLEKPLACPIYLGLCLLGLVLLEYLGGGTNADFCHDLKL